MQEPDLYDRILNQYQDGNNASTCSELVLNIMTLKWNKLAPSNNVMNSQLNFDIEKLT
jgi:hypothetical protein